MPYFFISGSGAKSERPRPDFREERTIAAAAGCDKYWPWSGQEMFGVDLAVDLPNRMLQPGKKRRVG